MSTITKEQLIEILQHRISVASGFPESEKAQIDLELASIALASIEAEAIAVRARWKDEGCGHGDWRYYNIAHLAALMVDETRECELVYTAPPAPASVPEIVGWEDVPEEITEDDIALASAWAHGFNQCRAAMLKLFCNSEQLDEVGSWNNHRNTPTAQDGNHTEQNIDMVDHSGDANEKSNPPVIQDGWVACSERMPEEDTYNVVADIGGDGNIYCAAAAWFIHGNFSPMDGISASNYDGGASIEIDMHISHWMPLPAAPQKEAYNG